MPIPGYVKEAVPKRYRDKGSGEVVEALQNRVDNFMEVAVWARDVFRHEFAGRLILQTAEGRVTAHLMASWVVRDSDNKFHVVPAFDFVNRYEEIVEEDPS